MDECNIRLQRGDGRPEIAPLPFEPAPVALQQEMALSHRRLPVLPDDGQQRPGHPPTLLPQRRQTEPAEPGAPERQPTGAPAQFRVLAPFIHLLISDHSNNVALLHQIMSE